MVSASQTMILRLISAVLVSATAVAGADNPLRTRSLVNPEDLTIYREAVVWSPLLNVTPSVYTVFRSADKNSFWSWIVQYGTDIVNKGTFSPAVESTFPLSRIASVLFKT